MYSEEAVRSTIGMDLENPDCSCKSVFVIIKHLFFCVSNYHGPNFTKKALTFCRIPLLNNLISCDTVKGM